MPTTIRLDATTEERLDHLAAQTGRTKAFYLRELIERGLDELEDFYLAAAAMERVRKGGEKVYPAEDVRRDLGLSTDKSRKLASQRLLAMLEEGLSLGDAPFDRDSLYDR